NNVCLYEVNTFSELPLSDRCSRVLDGISPELNDTPDKTRVSVKKGDGPKSPNKKGDGPKSPNKKGDGPKSTDKKADEQKSTDKKADGPKSPNKKADGPKSPNKKADEPKSTDKKGNEPNNSCCDKPKETDNRYEHEKGKNAQKRLSRKEIDDLLSSEGGDLTEQQLHNTLCSFTTCLRGDFDSFKKELKDKLVD
ncbi:hypothetical protein POWCR01_080013800, partial [Plasmodium ovale]